ncbi:hypothetical protein [Miltoncostaea oceani]|uniref:hypothetical protein n=1 Tax=Miltoncostaea oceani TaxID=2843216 RepID=UPI001C3D0942|nr:hypothetical protein [Miltoncostaea oceani]
MNTTPQRASEIPGWAAAAISPLAVHYSAGRATGAHECAISFARSALPLMGSADRARLLDQVRRAHEISGRFAPGDLFHNAGERAGWAELITAIETVPHSDGSREPLRSHGGRTIALAAISAMRTALGRSAEHPPAEVSALAGAIAAAAPEFSPSDRVLLLRDLSEEVALRLRGPGTPPLGPEWAELYATVRAMELDEDYLRFNRLGDALPA